MEFSDYFAIWDKLDAQQQQLLLQNSVLRKVPKGTVVHNGNVECTGLILVRSGQLRAYILSDEGREITIEAEKDTEFWVIRPEIYKQMMLSSALISNYTNQIMATRFSDVMWLMEQVLWKSFDKRLADFLLQEADLEGSPVLKTTHEAIGNHLGNPREVVTRMLRYFQNEGLVHLTRGTIEIVNRAGLEKLAQA